jgi:hypothetical protein
LAQVKGWRCGISAPVSTNHRYWLSPIPVDGLLSLICAWPEIGLPETQTDIILADLAVRAAETFPLWDAAEDSDA